MDHSGKDTGGSQFFICLSQAQTGHLNGKHTVFGQITRGESLLDKIKQGDRMIKVIEMGSNTSIKGNSRKKGKINRQALQQKLIQKRK
jgi:cyclophilin family peptidyl-prolyl cis-trans isomerase